MEAKYVLICSDEKEGSTDIVCDWLNYYQQPFIRISSKNPIKIMDVRLKKEEFDIEFAVDERVYWLSEIKSYWYRRSSLEFERPDRVEQIVDGKDISEQVDIAIHREFQILKEYFEKELDKKAILNKESDNRINKLVALRMASDLGLAIPNTLITREKKSVEKFSQTKLITKAIGDFFEFTEDLVFYQKTNLISADEIAYDSFFSTLFQHEIDKEFELRIFFMDRNFYTSAIFSQSNQKTKVDFRNYDSENPNRVTPFQLPKEIETKLLKLMDQLDMKSGSLDLIYTKKNEYVFLEVNPVGQFEQVSFPCNYSLHQKIAHSLSTNSFI